ncbi:heterokaryon incompatibility protein-domain-containing protein [Alternaria rosae]|uniref:heterokaryon incompatibility protein-domain-containing protein n=1 Tax=Alternaria rosae TaxID=1187941 RepID=UPI001E8DAD38|nr:heterokaryon incompatibility protein-domain-containing protein [Alternaria rosae]KAH6870736.1 heterokaryon incompatibility protein-domain-containing protein [Alternaria rosae]
MRLLRAVDMTFHEFEGSSIPPYAILSHRWEGEEVTYQEISERATFTERRSWFIMNQELKVRTAATERKSGFKKIRQCCEQALEDMIEYVWVDTCCIDKSSSAELSEAINSMYAWYQRSLVCYAYLADVHIWPTYRTEDADGSWAQAIDGTEHIPNARGGGARRRNSAPQSTEPITSMIGSKWWTHGWTLQEQQAVEPIARVMRSNWWTRGWTLQELIAPSEIIFYANGTTGWSKIGDKSTLLDLVAKRTGIEKYILLGGDVMKCSVAQRMSWASERETTRMEDLAYCLLGIFGVNMPLLYGEGSKAFLRLQEEIMKQSDDQTLFAWQLGFESTRNDLVGPLAIHPSKFRGASTLMPILDDDFQSPYSMTNKGLRIELPIVHHGEDPYGLAFLHCGTYNTRTALPVVRLGPPGTNRYARDARSIGPLMTIEVYQRAPTVIFMSQEPGIRVEKRRPLQVVISQDILMLFDKVYCSARVDQSAVSGADAIQAYTFPVGCRRGAILMPGYGYNLLLLFNVELQHVGRYTCKVIYAGDRFRFHDYLGTKVQEQILRMARKLQVLRIKRESQKTNQTTEAALVDELEQLPMWNRIHGDSGPPNNRTSFADLPDDRRILAKFAPYDALDSRDDGNLVLHIDMLDQSEGPQELFELE